MAIPVWNANTDPPLMTLDSQAMIVTIIDNGRIWPVTSLALSGPRQARSLGGSPNVRSVVPLQRLEQTSGTSQKVTTSVEMPNEFVEVGTLSS